MRGGPSRLVPRRAGDLLARLSAGALVAVAGLGLAGFWFATGWFAAAGFTTAVAATGVLGARRGAAGWLALGALVAYGGLQRWGPGLPVPYDARLGLEVVAALLPVAWVVASHRAMPPGRVDFLGWAAAGAALAGGLLRILEVAILMQAPGTGATIRHSLRVDVAYVLWMVAALVLALSALLARPRSRRDWRVAAAAGVVGLLVIPAVDVGTAIGVAANRPHDLRVGIHANGLEPYRKDLFDFAHLEVPWGGVEREEGARNWSVYDARVREAEARGIPVYLLVSTYPPRWLVAKHPEAVMVDAGGGAFMWIDEPPGAQKERVWDVSFHHGPSVRAKLDFLRAALGRYADSPAVEVVAVLNEPAYPSDWNPLRWASYDPYTVLAFRKALRGEVEGNLSLLNERYGTEFGSWREVVPPERPLGELGARWREFREDALIEHVHRFVSEARLVTEKPVTVKIAAHYLSRFAMPQTGLTDRAVRAMAAMSDVVSVDLYPVSAADLLRNLRYYRSLAGEKPLFVSEFNLAFGPRAPLAGAQLLGALAALDEHAEAVVLFTMDDHFLYGIEAGSPVVAALKLFRARAGSFHFPEALALLVGAEVRNVGELAREGVRALGDLAGEALVTLVD